MQQPSDLTVLHYTPAITCRPDVSVIGVVAMDDLLQVFARQVDTLATVAGHATAWEPVKPRV